ncbi:MAG: hypothetical protein IJ860_03345 [Eubacterium sp.]|nr:hypothetical protein [Eubacterium sp.]
MRISKKPLPGAAPGKSRSAAAFKKILPLVALLALLVLVNGLLNYALVPYQYPRVKIHAVETRTYDDLVLGTSHSFSAINPEILSDTTGRSCFNASVGSQFPRDTLYLLQDACRHHMPGRVILEYDPAYLIDADRAFVNERYFVQCMEPSPVKLRYFLDCALNSDFRVALMPWIGHRGDLGGIRRNLQIRQSEVYRDYGVACFDDGNQRMTESGQMRISNQIFDASMVKQRTFSPDDSKDNLADLERVLKFCSDRQIPVVLVTTPVPAETRDAHADYYRDAHQLMAGIAGKWQLPFLDYAYEGDRRLNDATESFSDLDGHMHEDAADAFSAVLAADLNACGA